MPHLHTCGVGGNIQKSDMEQWSHLCTSKDVEEVILSRLERIGLSAHMKQLVGKEIDNPDVHINDLERTAFSSFINSG